MSRQTSNQIYGPLHFEMAEEQKLLHYHKKFYSDSKSFNYFENLESTIIEKINSILTTQFPEELFLKQSTKRYISILTYLMNPKENTDFITFDEKIAFLIQAIDPELSIYFHFLRCGYSSQGSKEEQTQVENDLIHFIKSIVGNFDAQFLKYEEVYFQRVLKTGTIISHVNSDFSSKFFEGLKSIHSFQKISEAEFKLLSKKADYYRINCETPHSINTVCFNINNPNSELELWNTPYKIIFLISVIDPNLNALKIYSEESHVSQVKKRMIEELGFYHEDFIRLEEMYRRRFFPEMRISEWGLH